MCKNMRFIFCASFDLFYNLAAAFRKHFEANKLFKSESIILNIFDTDGSFNSDTSRIYPVYVPMQSSANHGTKLDYTHS